MATQVTTPNYEINYNDERLTQINDDRKAALTEIEQAYGNAANQAESYYNAQIDASKQWGEKQQQIQQEQTDFAIEQIEQQKQQAEKDYTKEQSGAYVDWQKQSNQYGAEAEKMAASGLSNTGYSETSQVSMYNTYQKRVAVARESYKRAVLGYNNAIKDARLHNNAALAEIAYQSLQTQLELALEGFQYKNYLVIEAANKKVETNNIYQQQYMQMLDQINQENALAEEVRQFNLNYELDLDKLKEEKRQFDLNYTEQIRQFDAEIARLKAKDKQEYQLEILNLQQRKAELQEEKRQFDKEYKLKQTQLSSSGSGGNGNTYTFDDNSGSNTDPVPNQASLESLGIVDLTNEKLAKLINEGKIKVTEKNGQLYFNWVGNALREYNAVLEQKYETPAKLQALYNASARGKSLDELAGIG